MTIQHEQVNKHSRRYTYSIGQKTYLAAIENYNGKTWRFVTPPEGTALKQAIANYKRINNI